MSYSVLEPPSRLAKFVKKFWVFDGEGDTERPYVYRSMADGFPELVICYRGKADEILADGTMHSLPFVLLHGQSQKFRRFITREKFGIFGVSFYPYAMPIIFSLSAAELTDDMSALENVLGETGKALEERTMLAPNNSERLKIVTAFLETKLKNALNRPAQKASPIIHAINRIANANETISVERLARDYAISTRQFERKFKEFSGFGPKAFARIARFQSVVQSFGNQYNSLTETAHASGYYDQSHFINDFRQFSGFTPKQYFFGYAKSSEHRES